MLDHYANPNKQHHCENVAMFRKIEQEFPIGYFQPNAEKAPWHVQAVLTSANGYKIVLNFWPCAGKAQREGEKSVEGASAIRAIIRCAIDDASDPDFDDGGEVIEPATTSGGE